MLFVAALGSRAARRKQAWRERQDQERFDRQTRRLERLATQDLPTACPDCGAPLQLKEGRRGLFASCSAFPRCRGAVKLDNR